MNDKHSLAEDKAHSLSEESRPLNEGVHTVGVYSHEDEARERYSKGEKEQKSATKGLGGFIAFVIVVTGLFIGTMVLINHLSSKATDNQPETIIGIDYKSLGIPPKLSQIAETTNGKSGREITITREFTGTVVGYSGSSTPAIVFNIGGVQQQYQFRMGNDGKVALGGTYRVTVTYWHNYWDLQVLEQVSK